MSKKSAKAEKRKIEKRNQKAARRALYQSYAEQGRLKGSKRARKKQELVANSSHPQGRCGNIGCKLCNPVRSNLVTPGSWVKLWRYLNRDADRFTLSLAA